jgi:hypothetical protein
MRSVVFGPGASVSGKIQADSTATPGKCEASFSKSPGSPVTTVAPTSAAVAISIASIVRLPCTFPTSEGDTGGLHGCKRSDHLSSGKNLFARIGSSAEISAPVSKT